MLIEIWNYQYKYDGKWFQGLLATAQGRSEDDVLIDFKERVCEEAHSTLTIWRQGYSNRIIMVGASRQIQARYKYVPKKG